MVKIKQEYAKIVNYHAKNVNNMSLIAQNVMNN